MSDICYPDSLIGSIPNLYYYAANNPSEATIAKRRSYANTISYLTPPAENAGLYKGLKVRRFSNRNPTKLSSSSHSLRGVTQTIDELRTAALWLSLVSCHGCVRGGQAVERQLQQHEQAAATFDLQH